jgi:hypothetical protein
MQETPNISMINVAELSRLFGALARAFTSAAEAAQAPPVISRRLFPVEDAKVAEVLSHINKVLNQ